MSDILFPFSLLEKLLPNNKNCRSFLRVYICLFHNIASKDLRCMFNNNNNIFLATFKLSNSLITSILIYPL